MYEVEISNDGSFSFASSSPHKGCKSGSLGAADVEMLLKMARTMNYLSLNASYDVGPTDLPSANTEVTLDGTKSRVHHYSFSRATGTAERSLTAFEDAIDVAVGTKAILAGTLGKCSPGLP